jgi:DNA-binding PadR family transcriptional regulator
MRKKIIKDSKVRKHLKWHILRLISLEYHSKKELTDKINDIYLGFWPINHHLIDKNLQYLLDQYLIVDNDGYHLTSKGKKALSKKNQQAEGHHQKWFSKDPCAAYSLADNV